MSNNNRWYSKNDGTHTWENTNIHKDNNYGKWTVSVTSNQPFLPLPTNDEMVADILSRSDDRGFFEDVMEWLRGVVAPRNIRSFLKGLCNFYDLKRSRRVGYDELCESVYRFGLRASPVIERRMILGPTNEWVKKYFEDFPFGS